MLHCVGRHTKHQKLRHNFRDRRWRCLLIKELMGYMDERTRHMFSLRMIGYSWDEIARILKNTANNAQVLFNQGLKKARSRVMKSKDTNSTSGKGGEADA